MDTIIYTFSENGQKMNGISLTILHSTNTVQPEWPYGPVQCNVTLDMCRKYEDSNTIAWNATCFWNDAAEDPFVDSCISRCSTDSDRRFCLEYCSCKH